MNPRRLKCVYVGCDKQFSCQSKLEDHLNVHRKIRPHVCDICDMGYPSKKGLDVHRRTHASPAFVCGLCGASFVHKLNQQRHTKTCPALAREKHTCRLCKKAYTRPGSYIRHLSEKHGVTCDSTDAADEAIDRKRKIKCTLCDSTFAHRSSLYAHRKIVHENKRCHCRFCGRQYSYASSLKTHMEHCRDRV